MAASMKNFGAVGVHLKASGVRLISSSQILSKSLNNFKGKKSSRAWLTRQINDPFVIRAQEENWRCRSAFKLIEIDDKFNVMKAGDTVIDCGAAPGSWSQVAVKSTSPVHQHDKFNKNGTVIAIDLKNFEEIDGVSILPGCDFTKQETQERILSILNNKRANVVLSDMAPSASGNREMDHHAICQLCLSVLKFSSGVLCPGGHVVCKLWDGNDKDNMISVMKRMFETVKIVKPEASRKDSAEIFLLGLNYTLKT